MRNADVTMLSIRLRHKDLACYDGVCPGFRQTGGNGLLCTAGLMNGVFGEGQDLHVAYWESVKVVDRVEEEGGDGDATVIREKERFSQRLTLLYADGRIALLSEKPREKAPPKRDEDAQRSPEDGNTDLCPTNS
jgi:hypothetical protein